MGKDEKKIHATQIRIPEHLAELVKEAAEDSHRSFNAQLIFLLETALGVDSKGTVLGTGEAVIRLRQK
jgi:hypothetical protein